MEADVEALLRADRATAYIAMGRALYKDPARTHQWKMKAHSNSSFKSVYNSQSQYYPDAKFVFKYFTIAFFKKKT